MSLAEPSTTLRDASGNDGAGLAPSMSTSLEHLVSGSQGVFNNRIDLALLEARESLSRSGEKAALVGMAMLLAIAAWFAAAAALVISAAPQWGLPARLAAFALLNALGAAALVTLSLSRGRRVEPDRTSSTPTGSRLETSPSRERNRP